MYRGTGTCENMSHSVNELQADDLAVFAVVRKGQITKSLICHAEACLKCEGNLFYTIITLSTKEKGIFLNYLNF